MYDEPITADTRPVLRLRTYTPSLTSSGMARRVSDTSTCVGGMKSRGPYTIQRSPGSRRTPSSVVHASRADSSSASSSPSTYTLWMPRSRRSPGCRKNVAGPRRRSFWPRRRRFDAASNGSSTTANWRLLSVVMRTSPTTFSYTSGVCVGACVCVTSHSSPALRCWPYASVNVRVACRCSAFFSVSTNACTVDTTSSSTLGRYAPVRDTSHCSPARRRAPLASVHALRARSFTAWFGLTITARTTSTTCTCTFG
mmetsp:Transcript_37335/g.91512  ORF Transcript_37335/g.91512 Transcript_37335/m.91512 type:complete len:254 (-) Transcript_37335:124-885(-)